MRFGGAPDAFLLGFQNYVKKNTPYRGGSVFGVTSKRSAFPMPSRTPLRRNGGSMMRGRRHVRRPGKQALASVPPHWTTTARPDLRASGSGRRPQRRMARLPISGHYAYPAVRSGTSVLVCYFVGAARSDRSRSGLAALNIMLTPVLSLDSAEY